MSELDKRSPLSVDQQNRIESSTANKTDHPDYDPYEDVSWWTICGFKNRLRYGRFYNIFLSSSEVTVIDIDAIVNIFALVDALILTIPIGLLAATKYSDWNAFEELVYTCVNTNPNGSSYDPEGYYRWNYVTISDNCMCSIYSSLLCLSLSVVYYLSRPSEEKLNDDGDLKRRNLLSISKSSSSHYDKEGDALINKKFRSWWKRGKILLLILFTGTTSAVISLVCAVNLYYEIFFTSSNDFCNATLSRVKKYSAGFYLDLVILIICLYIVI